MPNQKRPLAVTVDITDIPADLPPGLGWIGATLTAISGPVVGSIVTTIFSTGQVTREAMLNIDGHNGAGLARIETDDPVVLRTLSAVAGILADNLEGGAG